MTKDLITGDLDATTSKLGAEMTDEQILEVAEQAWIDSRDQCHAGDERAYTLAFARAILARQPAAIDKQEAVRCRVCNGHGYRTAMSATGEGAFNETCVYCGGTGKASLFDKEAAVTREEIERARDRVLEQSKNSLFRSGVKICAGEILSPTEPCDKPPAGWTCSRTKGHEGPCAASPAAPSVEQDERGAFDEFMEAWERTHRVSRHNPSTREAFENGWAMARAASTSANVAQGAEAVALEACRAIVKWCDENPPAGDALWCVQLARQAIAQQPAQTALTDDARDAARYRKLRVGNDYEKDGPMVVIYEKEDGNDARPYWVLADAALDAAIDAALTAAQSASASEGK